MAFMKKFMEKRRQKPEKDPVVVLAEKKDEIEKHGPILQKSLVVKVEDETVIIHPDEPLLSITKFGKTRYPIVFIVLLLTGLAAWFAVWASPKLTTERSTEIELPTPPWWQIVIAFVLAIILAVFFGVFIIRELNLDVVTDV